MSRRLTAILPEPGTRRDAPMLGIGLALVGMICVAISHAGVKTLGGEYPPNQILLMRTLVAGGVVLGIVAARGELGKLRFNNPRKLLLRASFLFFSQILATWSIQKLSLVEATVLMNASPIFITMMAAFFLSEAVGWRRWSAIGIGFAGVIVMLRPSAATLVDPASLIALASAVAYAAAMIMTRAMKDSETGVSMVLSMHLWLAICGGVLCFFWWTPMTTTALLTMIGIGLMAAFFAYAFTQAFIFAPVSLVAPMDYSLLVWAVLIGYVGWGEVPDFWTLVGGAMILGGGLFIALRESQLVRRGKRKSL